MVAAAALTVGPTPNPSRPLAHRQTPALALIHGQAQGRTPIQRLTPLPTPARTLAQIQRQAPALRLAPDLAPAPAPAPAPDLDLDLDLDLDRPPVQVLWSFPRACSWGKRICSQLLAAAGS